MAGTSYKIRGIQPPDLPGYGRDIALLYWSWVVEEGIKAKVADLKAGLDKDGQPMRAIAARTRKYRRSAMTPSGKGDPSAPPLIPGWQKSRTISLLNGRALATHAEFYWRFDPFTGDEWGAVLKAQAGRGRDVIGLSPASTRKVQVAAFNRWEAWKRQQAPPPKQKPLSAIARPRAIPTPIPTPRTWPEWERHFRESARAIIPARKAPRQPPHITTGPQWNRLLGHVWRPGRGPATGTVARPAVVPPRPAPARVAMAPAPAGTRLGRAVRAAIGWFRRLFGR